MPQVRSFTLGIYCAIGHLTDPNVLVPFSNVLRTDLAGMQDIILVHKSKHFLAATLWPLDSADIVVYVDACTSFDGIGINFPSQTLSMHCRFPIPRIHPRGLPCLAGVVLCRGILWQR